MEANKVFGQGKGQEADKLNIDSIIARLLEGKNYEIGLNRKLIDLNSISNSLTGYPGKFTDFNCFSKSISNGSDPFCSSQNVILSMFLSNLTFRQNCGHSSLELFPDYFAQKHIFIAFRVNFPFIPVLIVDFSSSSRRPSRQERAVDRERDPRSVPQVEGDLPLAAHPPRARGATQNLR